MSNDSYSKGKKQSYKVLEGSFHVKVHGISDNLAILAHVIYDYSRRRSHGCSRLEAERVRPNEKENV